MTSKPCRAGRERMPCVFTVLSSVRCQSRGCSQRVFARLKCAPHHITLFLVRVPEIDFNGAHPRLTTDQRANVTVRVKHHNNTSAIILILVQYAAAAGLRANGMCTLRWGYFRTPRAAAKDADAKLHTWARKKEVARWDVLAASREALAASHDAGKVQIGKRLPIGDIRQTQVERAPEDTNHLRHRTPPDYTHIPVHDTH